jgi:O-antigen ligase
VALALFSFILGLSHSRPTMNDLRVFAEVLMGIGVFFLLVNNVRDKGWLRFLTGALILGGAAQSTIGILFYFLPKTWTVRLLGPLARLSYPVGLGALRYINDDPNRPMRAIGTSVDPNILGAMLVMVLAVAGVQLVARQPVLRRWLVACCVALMGVCLFLTYSRGSMFGAVAALGLVALLRYRRLLVVLLIAGLLLLLLPWTQAYVAHFVEGIRIEDRSTLMRMGEYRDTIKLIQRYPWLGVGFVGTPDIDLYLAVAMIYLTILGQMGIVGLVAFLVVMATFFWYVYRAWRTLRPDAALEPFVLGYGAAIFGSLMAGLLDHTLLTYPHAVALLWFVLGMGTVSARLAMQPD